MRAPRPFDAGALVVLTSMLAACADASPPMAPPLEADARATLSRAPIHAATAVHIANVMDQPLAGGGVYAPDAAILRRTPNGFSVRVRMPTPPPGTYEAPESHEDGPPEAFTLWIFADGIPFLGAGHVVGGPYLTLTGHISRETVPFTGGEPLGSAVANASVRITIAPHGKVDPEKLPDQIKTPAAGPDFWWWAEFD
jgi:hypothetical protein